MPDIKLVISDLDGTLLDGKSKFPPEFWPLLEQMRQRGVLFAPASGRQYANLLGHFGPSKDMPFIAENGAYVVQNEQTISLTELNPNTVRATLDALENVDSDFGLVFCGAKMAYCSRTDEPFLEQVRKYYAALEIVDDLRSVDAPLIKVAGYDFDDAEANLGPVLEPLRAHDQVVISGKNWVDVMDSRVNKGLAVRALQKALDISPQQTAVFGDFLNDLEMMSEATYSYAVANADPRVKAAANYQAPANTEHGVITVIKQLLDL